MTTPRLQPSTPDTHAPGNPSPAPARKWLAGGIAAVIVAGGGVAGWVGSGSSDDASAAVPGSGPMGGPAGPAGPAGGAALGPVLHGEFVTTDDSGGYVAKFRQTGQVTALSATSITARSDDGFTKVYTIDPTTATGITNGEEVTIVATTSGATATATSVTEAGSGMNGAPPSP
ncbi:hypothetical protein [Amycolatopsis sp. NPDC051903]|uniref:hypothetical protein n=1 Tax=Amycolatopsis sp. NPDC051903 TaxID=3363936 RepID=UPI00378C5840